MTNKEKCSLIVGNALIPDPGLGEFIEGYTNKMDPFPYKLLWWFLVPIVGQILVPMFVIIFFLVKLFRKKHVVYLYTDGILWESKPFIGRSEEISLRYDEIGGIMTSKTRHYQSTYGISHYTGTEVVMDICDKDGFSLLLRKFSYRNEHETDDQYNALGFAMVSILRNWNEIALDRFNKEFSEKGFGTFRTKVGKSVVTVSIGRDFIKTEENYAGSNFKYAFQDGFLYIYPSEEDRNFSNKKEYFTINVNDMYDNNIFLLAASQLLGIK